MSEKPNILFIMTDDQAKWTLGAEGHPNAFTPELDKLASEGARFDNFFANAAVCSPSRATQISGRYASEAGIDPHGDVTHIRSDADYGLKTGITTWPQVLQDGGYTTVLVGKWHLGRAKEEYSPLARGYDRFSGWMQNGNYSRDPFILVEGEEKTFEGEYTSDVTADLAMDYMKELKDETWAMSLHFWAPHANHGVPDNFELPYNDRTWLPLKDEDLAPWRAMDLTVPNPEFPNLDIERIDRMAREYHASVHSVDRNIGRIMRFLEETGLDKNTVVIFTSDQGYNMAHHGLWHKGNGWWITKDKKDPEGIYTDRTRENLFDSSIRTPGIIRWPGVIEPKTVVSEDVSFVDWFPTILEMTGITAPEGTPLRGRSFVPLLRGEKMERENTVFSQHRTLRSCRCGGWKLILDFGELKRHELYNVREDPFEKQNLIHLTENPLIKPIAESLDCRIRRTMEEINDPLLK